MTPLNEHKPGTPPLSTANPAVLEAQQLLNLHRELAKLRNRNILEKATMFTGFTLLLFSMGLFANAATWKEVGAASTPISYSITNTPGSYVTSPVAGCSYAAAYCYTGWTVAGFRNYMLVDSVSARSCHTEALCYK